MAVLPDTNAVRPIPRPSRGYAPVNPAAAGAVGAAVSKLGDASQAVGLHLLDRQATNLAKDRDNWLSDEVRRVLYDPDSGYMSQQGSNAVNARARTVAELEKLKETALAGLSTAATDKLKDQVESRIDAAMQRVDTHNIGEQKTWAVGASTVRAIKAGEDAIAGLISFTEAEARIISEYSQIGAITGESEKATLQAQAKITEVYVGAIKRTAATDPIAAMAATKRLIEEKKILPSVGAELETMLMPKVEEYKGTLVGNQYYQGVMPEPPGFDWDKHRTQGGLREDAISGMDAGFRGALANLIASAPPEIKDGLQVYSGYRSNEVQTKLFADAVAKYGSESAARRHVAPAGRSHHNFGQAGDLSWNGMRLDKAPAHVRQWVHDNAEKFGLYFRMGHEPWHIEPIPNFAADKGGGLTGILTDPTLTSRERDAAVQQFTRLQAAAAGQARAAHEAASSAATRFIREGGSVTDLPIDQTSTMSAGELNSLSSLQKTLAETGAVVSDPDLLNRLDYAASMDRGRFIEMDLRALQHLLSTGDYDRLSESQLKMKSGEISLQEDPRLKDAIDRAIANAGIPSKVKEINAARAHRYMLTSLEDNPGLINDRTGLSNLANAAMASVHFNAGYGTEPWRQIMTADWKGLTPQTSDDLPANAMDVMLKGDFTVQVPSTSVDTAPEEVPVPADIAQDVYNDILDRQGIPPTVEQMAIALALRVQGN